MSAGAEDTPVRVVLVTAPDVECATALAGKLLEERLAACVNVVQGVRSLYRWEGRVQDDAEVLLVIKTIAQQLDALVERVREMHPYDVPEVLALPAMGGSAEYLDWVAKESSA